MIVQFVVIYAISSLLTPKPKPPAPGNISDSVPAAEAGREIPVLFGTRIIGQPNVVWWGHLRTVAIKSKSGKK